MDAKQLRDEIKRGEFRRLYLFYGEERYLVRHYANILAEALGEPDNFDASSPVGAIISAADSLPFFADKRLINVKDSKLFASGRKDDSETMTTYLPQIPESAVLVFMESEVDRRGRLYKKAAEIGGVIECKTPQTQDLITWLSRTFSQSGKTVDPHVANLLIRYAASNMTAIAQEAEKLTAYAWGRTSITAQDIQAVCTPTLQARVFDLVAAMGEGRVSDALGLYHAMIQMKEQPLMILAMVIRQFRIILLVKAALERKMSKAQMAKELELRSFIVDEALGQARRFNIEKLFSALRDCQDVDYKVKNGLINAEIGVELLIVQYGL